MTSDPEGILSCLQVAFAPHRGSYTSAAYEDTVLKPETLPVVLVAADRNGRVWEGSPERVSVERGTSAGCRFCRAPGGSPGTTR